MDGIPVNFYNIDIFNYIPSVKYDFISMCEILEHLEEPLKLLQKAKEMLRPGGTIFITTPINSPALDHLFLFESRSVIHSLLQKAGLKVEKELAISVYNMDLDEAEKKKIPIDYFASLSTL